MRTSLLLTIITFTFFVSCQSPESDKNLDSQEDGEPTTFAEITEDAHKKVNFLANDVVAFDLLLKFRGEVRLEGEIIVSTDSRKGIIKESNGDILYYDENQVFVPFSEDIDSSKLRFKAYTWTYFFLLPYKLTDPGTVWSDYPNKSLNDAEYNVEKLSFEAGTGDAPDDWYVVYTDKESNLINLATYIVTFNKSAKEAEEDPHAIEYTDYKEVDGVPIAHKWTFWGWKDGVLSDTIGEAWIENLRFSTFEENDFNPPSKFVEI